MSWIVGGLVVWILLSCVGCLVLAASVRLADRGGPAGSAPAFPGHALHEGPGEPAEERRLLPAA